MKGLLIRWRPNQQEDAHEFLLGMFDHINYDLKIRKEWVLMLKTFCACFHFVYSSSPSMLDNTMMNTMWSSGM